MPVIGSLFLVMKWHAGRRFLPVISGPYPQTGQSHYKRDDSKVKDGRTFVSSSQHGVTPGTTTLINRRRVSACSLLTEPCAESAYRVDVIASNLGSAYQRHR